jgi:hypothetical protein
MSLPERALLTDRFSFSNPPLLFARARLFADRLELTGWHLWRRYRRDIRLHHILQVDALAHDRLVLWLAYGETVRIRIRRAMQWKVAIVQQASEGAAGENAPDA